MQENCLEFHRSLVWFRRDLRNFDHAALHHALKRSKFVFCVFIFDKSILDNLPKNDRRVAFIHESILELANELRKMGGDLLVRYACAEQEIPQLVTELGIDAVFVNRDYEPLAIKRDLSIQQQLHKQSCAFFDYKDQVIFEKSEILTQAGEPFSVFTPYKNAWLKKFHTDTSDFYSQLYQIEKYISKLTRVPGCTIPSLAEMGFQEAMGHRMPIAAGMSGGASLLEDFLTRMKLYDQSRDFPAVKGPSYLSVHLRFGTVSIRHLVRTALQQAQMTANRGAEIWLSELIWRDFYYMILHHHPRVMTSSFKPDYDLIEWETGPLADEHFVAWCEGRTGYPLVDAAMQQLIQTGYMHNRLRMVTASFLVKDLGIDWRRGEAYFATHLNDFDLSANNGGWQWAASSGCDAQPYFRIFNPIKQSEKFDAEGKFIKRYLPQLAKLDKYSIHAPWKLAPLLLEQANIKLGEDYPYPIVDHEIARKQTLARYAVVKKTTCNANKM